MAEKSQKSKTNKSTLPRKIKFKYIFDDNYNPVFANGVFGGITPSRQLEINFFFDRHPIPYSETKELSPRGIQDKVIERKPEEEYTTFVRFVNSGVILTLEDAKIIHDWLGKKIKLLENILNEYEKSKNK